MQEWENASPYHEAAESIIEHFETTRAMQAAADDDEKRRIWWERNAQESARREGRLRPLRQKFGGAALHLLDQYERYGLINATGGGYGTTRSYYEWLLAGGQIGELASRFDALSRRL